MHLDPHSYAGLLDGTLPTEQARALAAHLDGGCEACEQFLAERGEPDPLDGATDAAISAALPPADGAGNDLEFARILRAADERRRPRRRVLSAAVAAALLVVGVGVLLRDGGLRTGGPDAWDGVKGGRARGIPTRLRFLEILPGGRIVKGIPGERVGASSSLVFEVEAGRAADLALLRVGAGGRAELIWRSRVAGGSTQVTVDGRPAAYPLAGIAGAQRFVLVASDTPIADARAVAAAAALAPPSAPSVDAPALDGLSLDVVDVSVR